MTEKQLREKVVNTAVAWLGCKESDGSHRKIIDTYNSHKPLARGYAVKYTDAWCSTFVSAVAIKAGVTDILPTECGCEKHTELFKKLGSWVENDAHVPAMGDVIFYDWQDTGAGDNTGYADHVGIVVSVAGGKVKIVEGNMNNAVGYRTIAVNGKYIRGYGVPDYAGKATEKENDVPAPAPAPTPAPAPAVLTFKVGDDVDFDGKKHYTNAAATAAKSCCPGPAKVTAICAGAKHPCHLIGKPSGGSTVYGWVDAADVRAPGQEITHTVVKGDTLWNIAKAYLGSGTRFTEIVALNGLKSIIIKVGQVLKIPKK